MHFTVLNQQKLRSRELVLPPPCVPPSNNVITSFLSTLIGQPHFGAEGPRNATRRTFPYVGGAAGHETSLGDYLASRSHAFSGDLFHVAAAIAANQSDCRI